MKPFAITQLEQWVERGCSLPGCTHADHKEIFVHQRCHPSAGLDVRYEKGTGVLNILCRECKRPVMDVSVALI